MIKRVIANVRSLIAQDRRGALLLGVVVVVAAGIVVAVNVYENPRVTLVTNYLEALRDRDIERAMSYVDPDSRTPVRADGSYLVAEALSSDWRITAVKTVDEYADFEAVRATITSHGTEYEGDFFVGFPGDEPEDLAIRNPYVRVDMPTGGFGGGIAFNGYAPPELSAGRWPERIALFPGSYRLFDEDPARDDHVLDPYVAMPNPDGHAGPSATEAWGDDGLIELLAEQVPASPRLDDALDAAVRTLVDTCAASVAVDPSGCPFGASSSLSPSGYHSYVDVGGESYQVESAAWEVETYPEATLGWAGDEPSWAFSRGSVAYTTSGRLMEQGGAAEGEVDLAGTCPIKGLDLELGWSLTSFGQVAIDVPEARDEPGAPSFNACTAEVV